ncbi:hypothetical protein GCM10027176_88260 [Actinoallomurus bryophytorum]
MRARETPDLLREGATPYYEVDPERSVWATTGYGQFRGDLVQQCYATISIAPDRNKPGELFVRRSKTKVKLITMKAS